MEKVDDLGRLPNVFQPTLTKRHGGCMSRKFLNSTVGTIVVSIACGGSAGLLAQAGTQGTIAVTVTDSSNAAVPGATLELTEISTNTVRHSKTEGRGTFNFVGLPIGNYSLAITREGFATTLLKSIVVEASQTTPIDVVMKVGQTSETVNVDSTATPLLDTTSNSIGSAIDLKSIENLPLQGRDLTSLARLTAGYAGSTGSGGDGIWNGQPLTDQGVNIDGVVGNASRAKYNGSAQASASPRVENIAEMAVQTDQIDLDQGFGRSAMQISFVTRSGTNAFHGRAYIDAQNSGLNANSYANNASTPIVRRPKEIYNDLGASLGGPILHDKLFFFGSFSTRRVPGDASTNDTYLPASVQAGNYTYVGTNGQTYTTNLFNLARTVRAPTTVNAAVAKQLSLINSSLASGSTITTADPNIDQVTWNEPTPVVYYWPTARLDWNATSRLHTYLSANITQERAAGDFLPPFPGSSFSNQYGGYFTRSFTAGFGAEYQINPRVVNQFKAGYLYTASAYASDIPPLYAQSPTVYWAIASSGQTYVTPSSHFYPVLNVSDSISWQLGSHSLKFGGSWVREQDHYYNNPAGFPNISLGLAAGDPVLGAINSSTLPYASSNMVSEAQNIYATLAGRISSVDGQFAYSPKSSQYVNGIGAYNLDELQNQAGLFIQDSWRVRPTLTFNYGLRWDFIGNNHDLTNAYHSITEANLYGPSSRLFAPGVLGGPANPTIDTIPNSYSPYYVTPQPQVGFAWNPSGDTLLGKLLGHGDSVIRGGYSLKRFTMPQQYYWNNTSSYGSFFFQQFYLNANTSGQTGTFAPGSVSLGGALPAYGLAPANYVASEAQSDFTFLNSVPFAGFDKHIAQPYTQSWNLGVERKLGRRAIEIRYDGNRTLHQWVPIDTNEVNVFENGFLQQFKNAQANLATSGGKTFKGSLPTPVFDAAFAGESLGQYGNLADYDNGQFTTALQNGQVGSVASTLSGISGTTSYFCNLVGASFAPCVNNAGFAGGGAGYPINYFQSNPYAAGTSTSLMEAYGYSNYNSLQADFRQQGWKGWTYDLNYTLGKNLGVASAHDYTGSASNLLTIRNFAQGYGPLPYDIRHTVHFTSTYDLPFGKGEKFLASNSLVSRLLGNFTVGSIMTIASGAPVRLFGGNATFNDYADGGITLSGVTAKQLQQAVQVRRVPGTAYATLLNPKYLGSSDGTGGANTNYINPNTMPGTFGRNLYLYGPKAFYQDMSVAKAFPLHDTFQLRIQGEFLNAWNHPVFGSVPTTTNGNTFASSVQSSNFATGVVTNTPRVIELRANIEF
jgi:hypothetical protein